MSRWQDDVTRDEWERWQKIAEHASHISCEQYLKP